MCYRSKWHVLKDHVTDGTVSNLGPSSTYQTSLLNTIQHNPQMLKAYKAVIKVLFPVVPTVSLVGHVLSHVICHHVIRLIDDWMQNGCTSQKISIVGNILKKKGKMLETNRL